MDREIADSINHLGKYGSESIKCPTQTDRFPLSPCARMQLIIRCMHCGG